MLKRCSSLLLLLLPAAAAAPWKLDPATTVTVDVGWEGKIGAGALPHPLRRRSTSTRTIPSAPARAISVAAARRDDRRRRGRHAWSAAATISAPTQYPTITFQLDKLTQTSKSTAEIAGRDDAARRDPAGQLPGQGLRLRPGQGRPRPLRGRLRPLRLGSTAPTSARPAALPEVAAVLPVHIRLLMTSR